MRIGKQKKRNGGVQRAYNMYEKKKTISLSCPVPSQPLFIFKEFQFPWRAA
jgi:hypothetical protein